MVISHILDSLHDGWREPDDSRRNPTLGWDLNAHLQNPASHSFANEVEKSSFAREVGRLANVAKDEAGFAQVYGLDHILPATLESEYSRKQGLVLDVKRKWAGLDESLQGRFGENYTAFMAWNYALMGLFKQELQRREFL